MLDPFDYINRFYEPGPLLDILVKHCSKVAELADRIVALHPLLCADRRFVYEAAMLHDIGIIRTNAPGIHCAGEAEYICHGILGAQMLRELGLERHARVCERHTGAGITKEEVIARGLPIPPRDYLPETVEEQIVCYADKFYSKTKNLEEPKTFEKALKSVAKHGEACEARFMAMHEKFAIE